MNIKYCLDCKVELKPEEIVKHTPRCPSCRRSKAKKWRDKNKEHYAEYFRNYRKTEKGKEQYEKRKKCKSFKEKSRKRIQQKLKHDPLYKLCHSCRTIVNGHLKKNKLPKTGRTAQYIGTTDYNFLKQFIESKFEPNMNWDNWGVGKGKWNLDHKIPLASASNEKELIDLFHYTNLQPMWAEENSSKGSLYHGVRHICFTNRK